MTPTAIERCDYADQHPVLQRDIEELQRRVSELEHALRGKDGIYDTLKGLEVKLASLTSSIRTAVALGTLAGSGLGTLAAIAVQLLRR